MISTNIISRVFRIVHNGKSATAYTIEKDDAQYLVSASHVFEGCDVVEELSVYHDEKWKKLPVQVIFNSLEMGDTIVFRLPRDISPRYPISYNTGGVYLGTWAFFLGFPFGMSTPSGELNNKFPLPFVKAGLVSSIRHKNEGVNTIFLDGHNNKGFSGGPVIYYHPNSPEKLQIIGTISGYLTESTIHSETRDDMKIYETNAGIIEAFWIRDLFTYI